MKSKRWSSLKMKITFLGVVPGIFDKSNELCIEMQLLSVKSRIKFDNCSFFIAGFCRVSFLGR